MGRETALISIIVPVFNEESAIDTFIEHIEQVLNKLKKSYELIFINDGSDDQTLEKLISFHQKNPHVKIINLFRRFGKEAALSAGLDYVSGDCVIPIDADLQDPPELIPALIKKWQEGFNTVIAVREKRGKDGFLKRISAKFFYKIFNLMTHHLIPENGGDFRLIDRKVVKCIQQMPERNRFMKGLFCWPGGKMAVVKYEREERVSGKSKWGVIKLWNFAVDGIVAFSNFPLKIWSYVGFVISALSLLYGAYIFIRPLFMHVNVPGYESLMFAVLFLGGIQLISIGLLGEYLSRVYKETKQRPIYVVDEVYGF